jgi:hypothetical protein
LNSAHNLFVHDRQTGTTEPVSDSPFCPMGIGVDTPSMSADGRYIAFSCGYVDSNEAFFSRIFLRDRLTGLLEQVDLKADGAAPSCSPCSANSTATGSTYASVSADGRYVSFQSDLDNLVPDDVNGVVDVFVRDRIGNTTRRVNVTSTGQQSARQANFAKITADGSWVAFTSNAGDLVAGTADDNARVYLKNLATGAIEIASLPASGVDTGMTSVYSAYSNQVSVSTDGQLVAFVGGTGFVSPDTNDSFDIFVRDRQLGTTEMASVSSTGAQGTGLLPPTFPGDSRNPTISADGTTVVFRSQAHGLAPLDPVYYPEHVFVRDRVHHTTERVSVSTSGVPGDESSGAGHFTNDDTQIGVSADGLVIAFSSSATNLVEGDTNARVDVFVRDRSRAALPIANVLGPYIGWAAPGAITLDASRSASTGGNTLSAHWDFGDSTTAIIDASAPVTHSYAAPGSYTVTLVVYDGNVASLPVTTTVTVQPPLAPQALSVSPACAAPGSNVSVINEHVPLVPLSAGWNLGKGGLPDAATVVPADGIPIVISGSGIGPVTASTSVNTLWQETPLEVSVRLLYLVPGDLAPANYAVTLVNDTTVSSQLITPCSTPSNRAPVASIGGPYTGVTGQAVQFDGTHSSDPEGAALTYHWSFGDFDNATGTGPTPTHVYSTAGTFYVSLVVNDGSYASNRWGSGGQTITTVTITDSTTADAGALNDAGAGGAQGGSTSATEAGTGGVNNTTGGSTSGIESGTGGVSTAMGGSIANTIGGSGVVTSSSVAPAQGGTGISVTLEASGGTIGTGPSATTGTAAGGSSASGGTTNSDASSIGQTAQGGGSSSITTSTGGQTWLGTSATAGTKTTIGGRSAANSATATVGGTVSDSGCGCRVEGRRSRVPPFTLALVLAWAFARRRPMLTRRSSSKKTQTQSC